jgi:hypothetical protein
MRESYGVDQAIVNYTVKYEGFNLAKADITTSWYWRSCFYRSYQGKRSTNRKFLVQIGDALRANGMQSETHTHYVLSWSSPHDMISVHRALETTTADEVRISELLAK